MAENKETTPENSNITIESGSNFLGKKPEPANTEDILYNDFFQESSNGEVMIGSKVTRSSLEVLVSIAQYITIFVVLIWIFWAAHVFVRSIDNASFLENYPFLCPYLNYDLINDANEKWCKNVGAINKEYTEKKSTLENNIIAALTEYIPIKVSASILDASPEKKFIITTYDNKPNITKVIEALQKVIDESQYVLWDNISCNGISIRNGYQLSTQCTILGWDIGNSDINGQIGSSRIEALKFIDKLSNTSKYSLILENRPTSLTYEKLAQKEAEKLGFSTRTIVPVQVTYVPLIQKP